MSSRDDMVIRPLLDPPAASQRVEGAAAPGGPHAAPPSRPGLLGRLLQSRLGGSAVARSASFARSAAAPVAAGAAMLAAILVRTGTGRTFENLGQGMREWLFGDVDEEVTAAQEARAAITSRPDLLRAIAAAGTDSVQPIYQDAYRRALMRARGRSMFMRDPNYQVDQFVDLLILRFQEEATAWWTGKDWMVPAIRSVRAAGVR